MEIICKMDNNKQRKNRVNNYKNIDELFKMMVSGDVMKVIYIGNYFKRKKDMIYLSFMFE